MQLDSDAVQDLIRALAVAGVLSAPLSSLNGDDEVMDTSPVDPGERGCFQFTWVGIAIFRDRPIVVYPKYIKKGANYFLSEDGRAEMQQVLRVVRKGASGLSVFHELDDDSVSASGMLALMLALIDSFSENGIYSNYLRVSKTNGNGAIDWGRTISRYQPFLSNGVPVYFDYETTETSQDVADYVTRLHRCVLTRCSKYLTETGLAELLSIDPIELSAEDLDDFGERDYILYKLEQERSSQFITWKQNVIDMLRLFISSDEVTASTNDAACLERPSFRTFGKTPARLPSATSLTAPSESLESSSPRNGPAYLARSSLISFPVRSGPNGLRTAPLPVVTLPPSFPMSSRLLTPAKAARHFASTMRSTTSPRSVRRPSAFRALSPLPSRFSISAHTETSCEIMESVPLPTSSLCPRTEPSRRTWAGSSSPAYSIPWASRS